MRKSKGVQRQLRLYYCTKVSLIYEPAYNMVEVAFATFCVHCSLRVPALEDVVISPVIRSTSPLGVSAEVPQILYELNGSRM